MNENRGVVIRARGLGKMYRMYEKPSDILLEALTHKSRHREHWALEDITFEVYRGEVVGVIGRNGAGKTTLLRIIAGTLDHTVGQIEVNGRISAIMVLGTGFNMDLSGRENILLSGLCLGMTHEEIECKTEDIIDFSGIRPFINSPCKEYSSGMLARLAFSIAVSVEPEILIVDEALATGDMSFQSKSYARMREIARSGATVLLVTHNLQHIYDLCDSAILLDRGKVVQQGRPRDIGYIYEQMVHEDLSAAKQAQSPVYEIGVNNPNSAQQISSKARIAHVDLLNEGNVAVRRLQEGETYVIVVEVEAAEDVLEASMGFHIRTVSGVRVYGCSTAARNIPVSLIAGQRKEFLFRFKSILNQGTYIINFGLAEGNVSQFTMLHVITDGMIVEAEATSTYQGLVNMYCTVETGSVGYNVPPYHG